MRQEALNLRQEALDIRAEAREIREEAKAIRSEAEAMRRAAKGRMEASRSFANTATSELKKFTAKAGGLSKDLTKIGEEAGARAARSLEQAVAAAAAKIEAQGEKTRGAIEAHQGEIAASMSEAAAGMARQIESAGENFSGRAQSAAARTEQAASQTQRAAASVSGSATEIKRAGRTVGLKFLGGVVLAVVLLALGMLALLNWQRPGWALTEEQQEKIEKQDWMQGGVNKMSEEEIETLNEMVRAARERESAPESGE